MRPDGKGSASLQSGETMVYSGNDSGQGREKEPRAGTGQAVGFDTV